MNLPTSACTQPRNHMGKLHKFSHRRELSALDTLLAADETTNFVQTVYQLGMNTNSGTGRSLLVITDRRAIIIGSESTKTIEIADVLSAEIKNGKKLLDFQTLQLVTDQGKQLEVSLDL